MYTMVIIIILINMNLIISIWISIHLYIALCLPPNGLPALLCPCTGGAAWRPCLTLSVHHRQVNPRTRTGI